MLLIVGAVNQVLNQFEDHIEITGPLNPAGPDSGKDKYLRFKFYPEGKSKSAQYLIAEG